VQMTISMAPVPAAPRLPLTPVARTAPARSATNRA
jgi:hypothetical protein